MASTTAPELTVQASAQAVAMPTAALKSSSETSSKTSATPLKPPRAARPKALTHRIHEQPAFVLHSWPYRETSLIIDAFTRDFGRIALIAKGAKRPHSALRGVLQHFQALSLSWSGSGELRTLTKAEWVGGMLPLEGDALLSGFYVNELMVKFCARDDAHPELFADYTRTMARLGQGDAAGDVLRSFERLLLQATGYAVALDWCVAERATVKAERDYVYQPEKGIRPAHVSDPSSWPIVSGQTLLDMSQENFTRPQTIKQSKALMRFLLHYHLHGAPLTTRQILIDLHKL